jgi:anti-sigma regulatory factor (Ser/Thr protein kinase)
MKRLIEVPNRLDDLPRIRTELTEFLEWGGVGSELAEDAFLVTEEVFVNVVSYGYEDGDEEEHRIEIELSLEGGVLVMEFRDDARSFDPLAAADPDPDAVSSGKGGLGIHLVRSLSDDVSYERRGGRNILRVERRVE